MKRLAGPLASLVLFSLTLFPTGCHDCPTDGGDCTSETVTGGVEDGFAAGNAEVSTPNQAMLEFMNYQYRVVPQNYANQLTGRFDEPMSDRAFGHTLTLPDAAGERWKDIKKAVLTLHLKSLGGGAANDAIGIVDHTGEEDVILFWLSLADRNNNYWRAGEEIRLVLDLTSLPVNEVKDVDANILPALHDGEISLYVQDDTSVDFIRLEASTCEDGGSE